MSNRIFYRPQYGLEKHYETDGKVALKNHEKVIVSNTSNPTKPATTLEIVADEIVGLQTLIQQLPKEILPSVQTTIDLVKFIFIQIDPEKIPGEINSEEIPTKEDPDLIVTKPDKIDPTDKIGDDYNFLVSPDVPVADINKADKDNIKLLDKYYSGSYLEIVKDYLKHMKQAINQYYADMAQVIKDSDEKTFESIKQEYTYKTTDLVNKDLQHVSDYIIKSQIVRDQKTRMYQKLFNTHEALNKLKACEGSRELYIRYLKEKKRENHDLIDIMSNMTLEQSKLIYEKKVYENLYELYKYLNSSVIILDECLNLYTKEAKAKILIINEEGINI